MIRLPGSRYLWAAAGAIVLLLLAPVTVGCWPDEWCVIEAHKGAPDPPPPPGAPQRDPEGATAAKVQGLWYVVRATRPAEPVYGPFLSDHPDCQAYARRYPFYRCVRLP